ncbi:hypothetical protein KCU65_g8720, partial [Aureobasidium melanogenum]
MPAPTASRQGSLDRSRKSRKRKQQAANKKVKDEVRAKDNVDASAKVEAKFKGRPGCAKGETAQKYQARPMPEEDPEIEALFDKKLMADEDSEKFSDWEGFSDDDGGAMMARPWTSSSRGLFLSKSSPLPLPTTRAPEAAKAAFSPD